MKRALSLVVLLACLIQLLCGCNLWLDGSYSSAKPHLEEYAQPGVESVDVTSFSELQDAVTSMVEDGNQSGMLYATDMNTEKLVNYMDIAVRNIKQHNPIGAYAVDDIFYEIGTNTGKQAIAIEVTYNHNRSEILRIKQTKTMAEAAKVITAALDNCDPGVVVQIEEYNTTDITQLVQDYVDDNPQTCMEMPQVTVNLYPQSGANRVMELSFTYQTSRSSLRNMQQTVTPVFASAKLYVSTDADNWEKYSQLYSFLMERYDYKVETSITPSYSLLRHGVGDSKAFAIVYAAMCRQAGLDCQVISGTKAGESWYWNVIYMDGVYYHIDLLQCSYNSGFLAYTDADMAGYVWDYSAYTQ